MYSELHLHKVLYKAYRNHNEYFYRVLPKSVVLTLLKSKNMNYKWWKF